MRSMKKIKMITAIMFILSMSFFMCSCGSSKEAKTASNLKFVMGDIVLLRSDFELILYYVDDNEFDLKSLTDEMNNHLKYLEKDDSYIESLEGFSYSELKHTWSLLYSQAKTLCEMVNLYPPDPGASYSGFRTLLIDFDQMYQRVETEVNNS